MQVVHKMKERCLTTNLVFEFIIRDEIEERTHLEKRLDWDEINGLYPMCSATASIQNITKKLMCARKIR
jgi:hypothetical protein